uniref:Uncharacterized protein n=1 Tax=Pseudomonas sp. (strain WBC-3) TaxID=165468 RepID=A0A0A0REU1_PSEWB|nr:hypothetical protein WBC3-000013 [Pseudomonas sp. WBC-3]
MHGSGTRGLSNAGKSRAGVRRSTGDRARRPGTLDRAVG